MATFEVGRFRVSMLAMRISWLLLATLLACGDDTESAKATTYHRDVRPLIDAYCVHCHQDGGEGPFALDTEASVGIYEAQIVDAVESGSMPKSKECPDFPGSFDLSDAQRSVFSDWREGGYEVGDPAEFVALEKRCTGVSQ